MTSALEGERGTTEKADNVRDVAVLSEFYCIVVTGTWKMI